MASNVTTTLSIRDNYTAVIKKAHSYTNAFQKDVQKMTERLDKASKKKHELNVKNSAAMKALSAVEKKIAPIRNVMVKVAANAAHFKNQFKPVESTFKKYTGKAWTVTLKVKDGVTAVIKKISSAIKKVGNVAGTIGNAVFSAGKYVINKGLELQSYDLAVGHIVGVNNPNASKGEIDGKTKAYLDWLKGNANENPFDTGDVLQAGTKAVQITEGNTLAAQGLMKMAEDMAALSPGKTIMEALEALANAQTGEFEGLASFGFNTNAKELKKAGYDLFNTKNNKNQTLLDVYGGGTDALGKTAAGGISIITGQLEDEIATLGLTLIEQMLPKLNAFLFEPIKEGGPTGLQVVIQSIQDLFDFLMEKIPAVIQTIMDTWASFVSWFNNPDGDIRKLLSSFGITLPTIDTGAAADTGAKTGDAGPKTTGGANANGKPIFPLQMHEAGDRQLTTDDAITGFLALKGGSFLSKLITGKGLITNGAKLVKGGAKLGAAAVNNGAIALAGASPAANTLMVNGTSWLGNTLAAGGSTFFPAAYYWWQDQKSLASYDYWEKTGGKDFDKAPWGDKAAVWLNRGLPGLNGWTPPGLVDGLNNLQNGTYTKMASNGLNLMLTQPDVANANFKKNLSILFGGVSGPVNDATTSFDGVSTAAQSAAGNIDTLVSSLSQVSTVHTDSNGKEHGGGSGKGFAAGIKRIPFDNYPALLHKGEAVLPSGEAGEYRRQGNMAGRAANNISLNITVNGANMDENRLASILVNKLQAAALNMA